MFLQGLYAALLSWRNSHIGSTWSWYMMWSGEIFFRSLERSNFWLVWPSSIDGDLTDRINSQIVIYAMVFFRRYRFTQSCYFVDRDLCDRVIFSWSEVWTPAKQYDLFYWSWVRFPGQITCFRPVWFMAYVTRPHKWWIRVMGKKTSWEEKNPQGVNEVTIVSIRLRWRGRLSIVGILV